MRPGMLTVHTVITILSFSFRLLFTARQLDVCRLCTAFSIPPQFIGKTYLKHKYQDGKNISLNLQQKIKLPLIFNYL